MKYDSKKLKEMSNAVRAGALRALRAANGGHVGIVLGAADIVTTIYANHLRRGIDRFVLSAGHGSALLYSVLQLAGYNIPNLESFRKIGGLPGHPEYGIDGVETTSGPLGQGVANAVGMAMSEKIKGSDSRVYCLCSDGDLMEGLFSEAIAFAGIYKLNNLIVLWDDNGVSIDGNALNDIDVMMRMKAAGWNVITVFGDNVVAIGRALKAATCSDVPTFIQCKTKIGRGSSLEGSNKSHGFGLKQDELDVLIEKYSTATGVGLWNEFAAVSNGNKKINLGTMCTVAPVAPMPIAPGPISTRELSGIYLQELYVNGLKLIGGSADLGGSTNVRGLNTRDITPEDFSGNYINYGVREHAMAAIVNGMNLSGVRAFASTFLAFSDYMRPAIRLAALSHVPSIFVLTHDSVAVGEDGPTHQPVEQLPSLRLIPNLNVFRPCNDVEVIATWQMAICDTTRPSCIILSRQKFTQVPSPAGVHFECGAYVIRDARSRRVDVTIIATGSEVSLAVQVAEKIGKNVQVVSMLSVSHFRAQSQEFKKRILRGFVVAIEAAATAPWFEFADAVVGIDRFGMSGNGDDVYFKMGFDADAIVRDILGKIKK